MANATYRGRIIVNDTDYTGSFVDPNPSGVATENLNTVSIDGTIYDIKSGNGNFKTKVLLNQAATSGTYSLADDYTNYDLLAFWTTGQGYESSEAAFFVMTVDDIKKAQSENRVLCMTGINRWFNFHITTSQFIVDSCSGMTVVKIVGYKIYADCYNPIIYSTEEREVGVWTNGKPLYAKTFIQQLSGNAGQVDISACGADMMFAHSGYYDIGVTMLGLNERLNNQYLTYTHVNVDTMQYIDCTNTIATNSTIVVCCLYTKTADVAGSAQYTTLGVPAHHYDGNEKIIGTWFGKTLYERTFNGLATNTNGDNWVYIGGIDATTWKDVINVEIYCNSSDVNNKLTRIALGEARVFNGNVQVTTPVSYNREINVATIQYTKNTD